MFSDSSPTSSDSCRTLQPVNKYETYDSSLSCLCDCLLLLLSTYFPCIIYYAATNFRTKVLKYANAINCHTIYITHSYV